VAKADGGLCVVERVHKTPRALFRAHQPYLQGGSVHSDARLHRILAPNDKPSCTSSGCSVHAARGGACADARSIVRWAMWHVARVSADAKIGPRRVRRVARITS